MNQIGGACNTQKYRAPKLQLCHHASELQSSLTTGGSQQCPPAGSTLCLNLLPLHSVMHKVVIRNARVQLLIAMAHLTSGPK